LTRVSETTPTTPLHGSPPGPLATPSLTVPASGGAGSGLPCRAGRTIGRQPATATARMAPHRIVRISPPSLRLDPKGGGIASEGWAVSPDRDVAFCRGYVFHSAPPGKVGQGVNGSREGQDRAGRPDKPAHRHADTGE